MQEENIENSNSKKSDFNPTVIIVVLVIIVAVVLFFKSKASIEPTSSAQPQAMENKESKSGLGNTSTTSPEASQGAVVANDKATNKTFDIKAGGFYFTPNKITVNKGDTVTLVVENSGGFHDLLIDEFNVDTKSIKAGDKATVTFVASKSGYFVYYCSVPGHKEKGMWGTLEVK